MTKQWTDAERAAFGEKMAAARAAKKSTTEVSDMAATEKQFAGPDDVPAGVRPIRLKPAVLGREVDAATVAGLQQAPDTGYAASTGAGLEVSGDVIGAGASGLKGVQGLVGGKRTPNASAILFSDKKDDGGLPSQMRRARGAAGPAEPTGLPCSCVTFKKDENPASPTFGKTIQQGMPTKLRGADSSVTWCALCGGERDGVARPENALRATAAMQAAIHAGVQVDVEGIAQRVLGMIDYDYIASAVAAKLQQADEAA